MAVDGINALIFVCQNKVDNANDNALQGAKKQSDLVKKEQMVHAQESNLEDYVRNKDLNSTQVGQIRSMLQQDGLSTDKVNALQVTKNDSAGAHYEIDPSHADGTKGNNSDNVDAIKTAFQNYDQDLQSQDKMGNFEVQSLMSDFNEAQTLASSVLKKKDDTGNAIIGKI
jgi:hypothetical protein